MKFKLEARLILFFCCLYTIKADSKKFRQDHCLASLHNLQHQLGFCYGRFLCDYYKGYPWQCIDKQSLCNGNADCPGGEDEQNCPKKVVKCQSHQMICEGGDRCASPCNGVAECDYGVDEHNCVPKCKKEEMVCPEGTCANICDGEYNCKDRRDETECKNKECGELPDVSYGNFKLLDLKNSFKGARAVLSCHEGYEVDGMKEIKCLEKYGKYSWETDHGTCVLKACNKLPTAVAGEYKVVSGSNQVTHSAILVCKLGFCLFPEPLDFKSIVCQKSGQWSTPENNGICLTTGNLALLQDTESATPIDSTRAKENAVDGIRVTTSSVTTPTCYQSMSTTGPFFEVKLSKVQPIKRIEITHPPGLLEDIEVHVGIGSANQLCDKITGSVPTTQVQTTFICPNVIMGDRVRIICIVAPTGDILTLCEVEIYSFMSKCNGLM